MYGQSITIVLSDEAKAFIKLQPLKAQQKIYYNIFKVEGGVWIRNSLRNWRILKYESCGRFSMAIVTACSPFVIMILRRNGKD